MSTLRALLVLLLLATAAAQQKPVDMADEPHHHLVVENDYLRAFRMELPGRQTAKQHLHDHDFVYITIGDANIAHEKLGESFIDFILPSDTIWFIRGGYAHATRNEDVAAYREVVVELKKKDESLSLTWKTPDTFRTDVPPPVDDRESYTTGLSKTNADILRVQLMPETKLVRDKNGLGSLLVALTKLELQRIPKGAKKGTSIALERGDVIWLEPAAEQQFVNTGRDPARFVLIEVK